MANRAARVITLLIAALQAATLAAQSPPHSRAESSPLCGGGILAVDMPTLVATADLRIRGHAPRSEAGVPIGNGRMGTLCWTTPSALHMQINRVDVFGNNKDTNSFPQRHTDYCGGCAFVDVDVGDETLDHDLEQHLSCYDGLASFSARDFDVRALAWMDEDVIALEVVDRRPHPTAIIIKLRMLRPPQVKHFEHTATSRLATDKDRLVLTQALEEGSYYCGSAVSVEAVGRRVRVERQGEQELRLIADAGSEPLTILISSAASFDKTKKLDEASLALTDAAREQTFAGLHAANRRWWENFWGAGFVWLESKDGAVKRILESYYYYLYLMACSSRGDYPTKFNGMLWTTGGDERQWGTQFWGANQSCLYNGLLPTNRLELLDPMYDMYTGMLDSCTKAAQQQWGSKGVFLPETVAFDGLAELPDDIAAEMRELYLVRKPMSKASEAFLEFARTKQPHSSRWNWCEGGEMVDGRWQPMQRPEAPFGPVTHIFSRGAKIAYHYWLRYEYTQDRQWLRERAYPMLYGVAEFYRNFPNVRKGDDGKYHIHRVNSNESVRGARDADEEIASMMGIFPTVIRASEILGVDADMRPVWQEFLDHLAPLPRSDMPEALEAMAERDERRRQRFENVDERRDDNGRGGEGRERSRRGRDLGPSDEPRWIRSLPPIVAGRGISRPDGNTMPQWYFDLCTLANRDEETMRVAGATFDGYEGPHIGVLSKVAVTAAMMGRADELKVMLLDQIDSPDRAPAMINRLDMREGRQTTSAQRLGRAGDALHTALVQSVGAGPAEDPVIRVFPAWPADWDAAFTLLCRGAFQVSSSQRDGEIEFVSIISQAGGECRLRNPWGDGEVSILRDGGDEQIQSGSLLKFDTAQGERVVVVQKGAMPRQFARTLPGKEKDASVRKANR